MIRKNSKSQNQFKSKPRYIKQRKAIQRHVKCNKSKLDNNWLKKTADLTETTSIDQKEVTKLKKNKYDFKIFTKKESQAEKIGPENSKGVHRNLVQESA